MKNIGIIFGGKSKEHEISCVSAYNIYNNIDRNKYNPYLIGINKNGQFLYFDDDVEKLLQENWDIFANEKIKIENNRGLFVNDEIKLDCIFPALHGLYGEDGRIQGFLDYINIKYVGNKYLSSAICMDKSFTKNILNYYGINQTKYITLIKGQKFDIEKIKNFKFPLFVKPSNSGSSIGISKVNKEEDLLKAIEEAFIFDNRILIEEGIDARELEVSIMQTLNGIIISNVGELIIKSDFYDYDTKYNKNTTDYIIPADISFELSEEIISISQRVFKILNCEGLARVDFFLDKNNNIFVNEINTMPGFTANSMYPKLFMQKGILLKDIITNLIELAMEG